MLSTRRGALHQGVTFPRRITQNVVEGQILRALKILGCHVIGERAVDIVQTAAIAIASGMRVDQLARIPLAYPTYAATLVRAAASAARELRLQLAWQANPDGPLEGALSH